MIGRARMGAGGSGAWPGRFAHASETGCIFNRFGRMCSVGLPPESIDLHNFNADALRKAPADLRRAISVLRQVAKSSPSRADEAYAMHAVDLIAALTQRPQLPAPILKLWEVEESIRNADGLWTLKHLVTIALAFAGVLVGSTKNLSLGYEMFAYVALALIVGSGALHLTHSKNAEMKVPVYTLGGLAVFWCSTLCTLRVSASWSYWFARSALWPDHSSACSPMAKAAPPTLRSTLRPTSRRKPYARWNTTSTR